MNVTPLHLASDADRLALLIRSAGYVDPDEVVELEDWKWEWFATTAKVPTPDTPVRCAVVALFGSPSAMPSHASPERASHHSRVAASEPEGCRFHGDTGTNPTGSTSRKVGS